MAYVRNQLWQRLEKRCGKPVLRVCHKHRPSSWLTGLSAPTNKLMDHPRMTVQGPSKCIIIYQYNQRRDHSEESECPATETKRKKCRPCALPQKAALRETCRPLATSTAIRDKLGRQGKAGREVQGGEGGGGGASRGHSNMHRA